MLFSRDRDSLAADLASANARISELEAELARVSSSDPISAELMTVRAFRAQLELDIRRAQRYARPLAVAILDVDRFRYLNLKHGYGVGDLVLGGVGTAISSATRAHDLACRLGGDEFAMFFSETTAEGALEAMGRILHSLEDLEIGGVRGLSGSVGVAMLEPNQGVEGILGNAAAALERARAGGGGQMATFTSSGEREAAPEDLSNGHGDVIAALAATLGDRRFPGGHSESVVDLAEQVAGGLDLEGDRELIGRLRTAALLHDIGKVGVPDEIVHKADELDDREWEIMRQYPVIGERIIRAIPGMGAIARIVRHQHERWDGNGYPDGLRAEEIPAEARIILVCDAYHAMTSDRPYREQMNHADAIAELTANAAEQFDPAVVDALVRHLYGRRQSGLAAVPN